MKTTKLVCVTLLLLSGAFSLSARAQGPTGADSNSAGRVWIQGEYLHWWLKGNPLPALVTTSPPGNNGLLPDSKVLFGGNSVDDGGRNGGRVSAGFWVDGEHKVGVDAGLILLGFNGGSHFSASSDGSTVLARPFFNPLIRAPDSLLIAAPGLDSGSIGVSTSNEVQSVSAGLRWNWRRSDNYRIDVVGGYRYFHYREGLGIQNSSVAPGPGITTAGSDDFSANNSFHGGEVGLEGSWRSGHWSLGLGGRIALGSEHAVGTINGQTDINGTMFVGDLLALLTNIGRQSRNSFAVLPQVNAHGAYHFGRASLMVGYSFLALNKVLRTGGQIDENVDPLFLPPTVNAAIGSPEPKMNRSTFWAQGLSAGLQFRF